MPILNIGSINIDTTYRVHSLPEPGQTIVAKTTSCGLGGKGFNQTVAISKAGGAVRHVGRIGEDGLELLEQIRALAIDTKYIEVASGVPTGSAIILVETSGENQIVISSGANETFSEAGIAAAVADATGFDWLLIQNETNALQIAVEAAAQHGMKVVLCAAPFDADAFIPLLPHIWMICLNEGERQQLSQALHAEEVGHLRIVTTLGERGARLELGEQVWEVPGRAVKAEDASGAGDTFLGYLVAGLDEGLSEKEAIARANAAAAIQVSRHGTSAAIPTRPEVEASARAGSEL